MILLLDHLDSFTYNLYQYVEELGFRCRVERANRFSLASIKKLAPKGIILSPGPGHPKDALLAREVLATVSESIPTFGVCLGHQVIGLHFGGEIARVPKPLHGKISKIVHRGEGVFRGLPSPLRATRYHSLYVESKGLPKALAPTAWVEESGERRILMGITHRTHPIEGVQFHPESVCTPDGKKMLANFLRRTK